MYLKYYIYKFVSIAKNLIYIYFTAYAYFICNLKGLQIHVLYLDLKCALILMP